MIFAHPPIVPAAEQRGEKLARLVYKLLGAPSDTERVVCGRELNSHEWRTWTICATSSGEEAGSCTSRRVHRWARRYLITRGKALRPKPARERRERNYDDD
jgi:hypothetical protein